MEWFNPGSRDSGGARSNVITQIKTMFHGGRDDREAFFLRKDNNFRPAMEIGQVSRQRLAFFAIFGIKYYGDVDLILTSILR